jgi:MmyB-like transcription regulator ligand binding domain
MNPSSDAMRLVLKRYRAEPAPRSRKRARRLEKVRPGLEQLIHRCPEQPAVIIGRHRDVLAANSLAVVLKEGFGPGRNLLRDVFLDPAARDIYIDWAKVAEGAVAGVRASAGTELDDPRLTDLIGELSLKSPEFRAMWARHDVHDRTSGTKHYNNPLVGEIALHYECFTVSGAAGQTLLYSPPSPAQCTSNPSACWPPPPAAKP